MRGYKSKLVGKIESQYKCGWTNGGLWLTILPNYDLCLWINGTERLHKHIYEKSKIYLDLDVSCWVVAGGCSKIITIKMTKRGGLLSIKRILKTLEKNKLCKNIKWDLINKEFSKNAINKIKILERLIK